MWIIICCVAHTSYYNCFRPILRCPAWSLATVLPGIPVRKKCIDISIIKLIIIEYNPSFHFIFPFLQFIERIHNHYFFIYAVLSGANRITKGKHIQIPADRSRVSSTIPCWLCRNKCGFCIVLSSPHPMRHHTFLHPGFICTACLHCF